jgi:hypothetical protein
MIRGRAGVGGEEGSAKADGDGSLLACLAFRGGEGSRNRRRRGAHEKAALVDDLWGRIPLAPRVGDRWWWWWCPPHPEWIKWPGSLDWMQARGCLSAAARRGDRCGAHAVGLAAGYVCSVGRTSTPSPCSTGSARRTSALCASTGSFLSAAAFSFTWKTLRRR